MIELDKAATDEPQLDAPTVQHDYAAVALELAKLPALPKPHVTWPLGAQYGDPTMRAALTQFARITGRLSLDLRLMRSALSNEYLNGIVSIVNDVRQTCGIDVKIAAMYSPWHWHYQGGGLNKTSPIDRYNSERDGAVLEMKELERLGTLLHDKLQARSLDLAGVYLDCERFNVHVDRPDEIAAYLDKLRWTVETVQGEFGSDVRIHWFGQGQSRTGRTSDGKPWLSDKVYVPTGSGDAIEGASYSAGLYYYEGLEYRAQEYLVGSHAWIVRELEDRPIVAWIALGSRWEPLNPPHEWRWAHQANYDARWSYELGRWLHSPDYPYNRVEEVAIFPEPGRSQYFWQHFGQYVRGATGMPETK